MRMLLVTLLLTLLNVAAFADPRTDITPVDLKFRKGLDDDITNTYSQHIYIYVKNTGTTTFRTYDPIRVSLNGIAYSGYLFASDEAGGSRGGPLAPGVTGKIFLRLPLNTLANCQSVNVKIDLERRFQYGPSVFSNDQKTMYATDFGVRRICGIIFNPHPPVHPFPLPIINH